MNRYHICCFPIIRIFSFLECSFKDIFSWINEGITSGLYINYPIHEICLDQGYDDRRYAIFINTSITQFFICFTVKRWQFIKIIKGCTLFFKKLLKRSPFLETSVIMSPFTRRGGIAGIFVLFRKSFSIDQYVLGVVNGSLSLLLIHLTYFSLASKIKAVQSSVFSCNSSKCDFKC